MNPSIWKEWAKRARTERVLVRVGSGGLQHVVDDLDPGRTMCGRSVGPVVRQSTKSLCGTCIWSWESREKRAS